MHTSFSDIENICSFFCIDSKNNISRFKIKCNKLQCNQIQSKYKSTRQDQNPNLYLYHNLVGDFFHSFTALHEICMRNKWVMSNTEQFTLEVNLQTKQRFYKC